MQRKSIQKRLKLRAVTAQDADALYTKAYSNEAFMQLFKLNSSQDQKQIKKALFEREKIDFEKRSYKEYAIEHPQHGLIGLAALADHNTFHNSAEILIGLFDEQHRKSIYGLQASLLLLDIAYNQFGLNRLNSYVYGHNQYAQRCTEKLGFCQEGLRKDYIYSTEDQSYIDVYCYGMRYVDFRANQRLARLSTRLNGKDITQTHLPKNGKNRKTSLIIASAICSKLALSPAYGKTSSSSTDTSAVISPSDGKTAAANNSSGGNTSSNSSTPETPFVRISCPGNVRSIDGFDMTDELLYTDSFYLKANLDLKAQFGNDYGAARKHWKNLGLAEGLLASPVFDVKYYLDKNPDVQEKFDDDYVSATRHWIKSGIYEGRIASPAFDVQYYLSANPDIYAYFGGDFKQATLHWLNKGIAEGRKFSENLNVSYYLNNNGDLYNAYGDNYAAAVTHWLLHGQYENREAVDDKNYAKHEISCDSIGIVDNLYHPGDYIDYSVTVTSDSSLSYGVQTAKGTTRVSYSSSTFTNPNASQMLTMTVKSTFNGYSDSFNYYVFFDFQGNLLNYKNNNKECYNSSNCNQGTMLWPTKVVVGDRWSSNRTVDIDGTLTELRESYEVVGTEYLSTPIGGYNTFKVQYNTGANNACTTFDCSSNNGNSVIGTGTVWYAQNIGTLKQIDNTTVTVPGESLAVKTTMLISGKNIK